MTLTKGKIQTKKSELHSLFVEDDSLHFDYGHCLPNSDTCSVIHGHSSRISAEVFGEVGDDGMILDFADAKSRLKDAIKTVDHKFIICKKYAKINQNECMIEFHGKKGHFRLEIPASTVYLLEKEATSENIASELAEAIMNNMPKQVTAMKLFFFEGVSKGATAFRTVS